MSANSGKDLMKHPPGEFSREGVLLAGVIRGKQDASIG
jgi:hypothetical protein